MIYLLICILFLILFGVICKENWRIRWYVHYKGWIRETAKVEYLTPTIRHSVGRVTRISGMSP